MCETKTNTFAFLLSLNFLDWFFNFLVLIIVINKLLFSKKQVGLRNYWQYQMWQNWAIIVLIQLVHISCLKWTSFKVRRTAKQILQNIGLLKWLIFLAHHHRAIFTHQVKNIKYSYQVWSHHEYWMKVSIELNLWTKSRPNLRNHTRIPMVSGFQGSKIPVTARNHKYKTT